MDVSDRRMQVQLTPEAKIDTDFIFIGAIFAVAGFISALWQRSGGFAAVLTPFPLPFFTCLCYTGFSI